MARQIQLCFKAHGPASSSGPVSGVSLQQTLSDDPDGNTVQNSVCEDEIVDDR